MTTSSGLLLYRLSGSRPEVLLGHMGGPYWARKDDGAWSIPKGEYSPAEQPLAAARREFREELGSAAPAGPVLELGEVRQRSGKRIVAFAVEGDFDPSTLDSNTFTIEWPPRSGRHAEFPEIDRAAWFGLETARRKLVKGQVPLLEALASKLGMAGPS